MKLFELLNYNTEHLNFLRYETVRRLNPREFTKLYKRNITTGEHFDDLVDQLILKRIQDYNKKPILL